MPTPRLWRESTSLLVSNHRPYRIRFQMSSKLEDLRDGPAVLIGAFNNSFTLRLTGPLRFSFLRNPETMVNRIQDRNDPQNPKWSDDMNAPYQNLKRDYAIVSRVVDPTTGSVVVTASGLAKFGTEAAGEFLTSRCRLEEMAKGAPRGLGPQEHADRDRNRYRWPQRRPAARAWRLISGRSLAHSGAHRHVSQP